MKNVLSKMIKNINQAQNDFDLLPQKGKGLIAVSGGKDSVFLLKILPKIEKFKNIRWVPVFLNLGYGITNDEIAIIENHFKEFDDYLIEKTNIAEMVKNEKKFRPCYRCSRLRKKRLVEIAHERDIKYIILGHHKDDFITTYLLNIMFIGETSSMLPKQELFAGQFYLIRPLVYITEKEISDFIARNKIAIIDDHCPYKNSNNRLYMENLLNKLDKEKHKLKNNVFKAMFNFKVDFMPKRRKKESE